MHLGWLALVIGVGALTAAALLAVARFGVSRAAERDAAAPAQPLGRPAQRGRRRHRSGAAPAAAATGGAAGRLGVASRGLAGSGRRDLDGAAPARPPGLLGGGAGDREPGRRGARRGVRRPGRHRRSGRRAGGGERRLRRRRRRRRWRSGSSSADASCWSAPRRSSPGRLPSATPSPASGGGNP